MRAKGPIRLKEVNPYVRKVREASQYIIELSEQEGLIALREKLQTLLVNRENIFVEIGSGSGNHIVELARRNTDWFCLGFELRFKRAFRTIEKSHNQTLNNVFIVRHDARAIGDLFTDCQVDGFYINFPDPWEKRRRRKNRTLGETFLDTCGRILKRGGSINFKTDHREYFETFMKTVAEDSRYEVEIATLDLHSSSIAKDNIKTEFEEMFLRDSIAICYSRIIRR